MLFLLLFAVIISDVTASTRVIGGRFAKPGQFPYQVSLQRRARHYCGGALITDSVVITAAHCVYGVSPLEMRIIAGTNDLGAGNGVTGNVKNFIVHPLYNANTQDYDMALVLMHTPFTFDENIQKIDMADLDTNYAADTLATISGYGAVNGNLELSNRLKYAQVQLWSRDFCNAQNVPGVTDRMICAGHPSGQVSACQGDSGGPLTVNNKLFGLVSWGFGCGAEGRPAMYTYVAAFRPWIKQNIGV